MLIDLYLITVIIRINAAAFIKFLVFKVRRLFEGGVYSRVAFIENSITTTVNLCLIKTQFYHNPKNQE